MSEVVQDTTTSSVGFVNYPTENNQSDSIGKLGAALAKAQGLIGNALTDKSNPFFKSSYADLASCWGACKDALSKNELAVVQTHKLAEKGDMVILKTVLIHSSGEFISGTLCVRPAKADPQGIGSATTYARRYGLCAMVGISPADDDGNAASGKIETKTKTVRKKASSKASKAAPAPVEEDDEF